MKALIDPLSRFAPPLWLTLLLAAALGAALMVAFVDALHQNVRHGEELRRWQRIGAGQPALDTMAAASPHQQVPQLGAATPLSYQR